MLELGLRGRVRPQRPLLDVDFGETRFVTASLCQPVGSRRWQIQLVRTYQARPLVESSVAAAFDAYGDLFGRALRSLHARCRAGRATPKAQFMLELGLTARQFNAVKVCLDGIERSYRKRQPELLAEDEARLSSARRRLAKTGDCFKRHHLQRRIARLEARVAARRAAGPDNVRVCFGSAKLFGAQHHLSENGFASREEWRRAWREARSGQFFVLGSKDETAACPMRRLTNM